MLQKVGRTLHLLKLTPRNASLMKEIVLIQVNQMDAERSATNRIQ